MVVSTRRVVGAVALAAGAVAPAAATAVTAHASAAHVIVLRHMSFTPRKLTVHRGDTVVFRWEDSSIPHNITSSAFHAPMKTHGTFTVRLTRRGTFTYHCTLHPGMKGQIKVT